MSAEVVAYAVRVTGRVQGVFYRASCAEQAARLCVNGWVGNEPDGSVRGHFEGEPDAVDALVAWCLTGPPAAMVDDVAVTDAEVQGLTGFEQR